MKKIEIFIASVVVLFFVQIVFAQSPNNPVPDWVMINQQARERERELMERANRDISLESARTTVSPAERERMRKESAEEKEAKKEFLAEINKKLAPPAEYFSAYADFLKQKNTGIARMLPDTNCDRGRVVDVAELERCRETPSIPGAGSLYSTRLDEIPSNYPLKAVLGMIGQSEIHLVGDKLNVGNKWTQGMIGEIGEADLAAVDIKSAGFKFLRDYEKAENTAELALKNAELEKGVESGGFFYSTSAPVKVGSVYALRSIACWDKYKSFWNTDVFVALKIVGREKDGSIIFIWKKLKQKDAPQLYR